MKPKKIRVRKFGSVVVDIGCCYSMRLGGSRIIIIIMDIMTTGVTPWMAYAVLAWMVAKVVV